MATYATKQRKELLDYLSAHPHEIFSVTQIGEYFKDGQISISSVYRNLSELAKEGMIRKVSKSGTREAYYQYVNAKACQNQIHLYCKTCEKSYHMNQKYAQLLSQQILQEELFAIDKGNTVIYGTCKKCRE